MGLAGDSSLFKYIYLMRLLTQSGMHNSCLLRTENPLLPLFMSRIEC